ncbi:MAG: glycerol-3-phosphate 1-O-acyltransferase PlsY [Acidobacteriaceae bacterium]|nr:glycerol-3-phosphate 1-O-acyltransferase PlsY [Acidobacteriaceae bacterium]
MPAEFFLQAAVPALLAYLIGGLPFGYLLVRFSTGKDVRTMGSGNIGATNVHRTVGRKAGLIVLLLDILKGFVAVWLAAIASHRDDRIVAIAIVAVMLGHCYPLLLRFKGGKAVACFIGAFLFVAPVALLVSAVIFLLAFVITEYISLGSITGAAAFPLLLWMIYRPSSPMLLASIAGAVLIVYRHKANISRISKGTEHRFSLRGGTAV